MSESVSWKSDFLKLYFLWMYIRLFITSHPIKFWSFCHCHHMWFLKKIFYCCSSTAVSIFTPPCPPTPPIPTSYSRNYSIWLCPSVLYTCSLMALTLLSSSSMVTALQLSSQHHYSYMWSSYVVQVAKLDKCNISMLWTTNHVGYLLEQYLFSEYYSWSVQLIIVVFPFLNCILLFGSKWKKINISQYNFCICFSI